MNNVRLRDVSMGDLELYRTLLTDETTMAELGGPLPTEGLEEKLRGIVDDVQAGRVWYSVIEPGPHEEGAGTVCIWSHDWDGRPISEMGWMVLPSHQGRGLASGAVSALLDRARSEDRWGPMHAFPGVTNAASNRICEKAGFRNLGAIDFGYAGRILRCNHWVWDEG